MKKITVLYFDGCPNHRPVVEMARRLIDAHRLDAEIEEVEVSPDEVVDRRFLGSPTVHVDGVDIEPAARERMDFAMSCRVYDTSDGLPTERMLSEALGVRNLSAGSCCAQERLEAGGLSQSDRAGDSAGRASSLGAVGAAVFSSACCWVPLLFLAFGVSAGGIGGMFESVRPYFLIAAALLLGSGFYFAYFRKVTCKSGEACAAPNLKLQRFNRVMLWVAAAFAIGFGTFPYYSPALVRALDAGFAASAAHDATIAVSTDPANTWQFDIEGMTCTGCAAVLEARLKRVPGVVSASVSYPDRSATVVVADDHDREAMTDAISKATTDAGFTTTPRE